MYTGTSISTLTPVAANDDYGAGVRFSRLDRVRVVSGRRYLIAVASNDDDPEVGSLDSRVRDVAVRSGTPCLIAVDGDGSDGGVFRLSLGFRPGNDDFAAARTIAGRLHQVRGRAGRHGMMSRIDAPRSPRRTDATNPAGDRRAR